ncbi:Metallo-dependent phosphatase, partial [Stereum hirsutum FP-91666 SS1]|uniref:Metallo-dependent phosphatase n=1 Tax=Stereum hirsutum (strain FP-91666) TaxID=721885 RepID=UPI0004449F7D
PPNHPGETWTRFVCISDTHSKTKWTWSIPDGDVLIHAGDLCRDGNLYDLKLTMAWLRRLPHPHKVIIAGNHDLCLDSTWAKSRRHRGATGISLAQAQLTVTDEAATEAGIHYLEHEAVSITTSQDKTWKFYGSPAAPRYASGAFQYRTATEADQIYSRIPSDTEILLTHTPPYGIQDETLKGVHAGCPHLRAKMDALSSCRLHVFGHIHEGHGVDINRIG